MGPPPMPKRRATLIGNHPVCTSVSMDETYEAGDVIGTGSFGIIRKVTRRVDGMILARKELNYGRMDERDLRQLTEEVNILEQLGSNDNIVRYYERFVDKPNNMLYILMEFCEGGDLSALIQRCRHTKTVLSEELVWSYLAQLTLALSDCHSEVDRNAQRKAIILHRDIKPENVFLDKENQLKLGDFGLSKAMAQASMTQTYVGTPYYMSPELINGQPYDVKSDIWALGCLIYELCAGHPPFHEARTQPELAVLIREGKIPDLPKPYSPHLGQVVKAMLKQNPKHRPNTAQLKALESVKIQIRILELRKVSKELRYRDAQATARESDLVAREQAVLQREQSVLSREQALLSREQAVRVAGEQVRIAQARMAIATAGEGEDLENVRPRGSFGSGFGQGQGEELLARVASRPSLVPRRPLAEERRTSNIGSLPFPRMGSCSSLMSLDDTPLKDRAPSQARRLGSKSMYDLASAASFARAQAQSNANADLYTDVHSNQGSPIASSHRSQASSGTGECEEPPRSPTRSSSLAFGRRSDSATSRSSTRSGGGAEEFTLSAVPPVPTSQNQANGGGRSPQPPPPASPTKSRPGIDTARSAPLLSTQQQTQQQPTPPLPSHQSFQSHSQQPTYSYDHDEVPSPFLKKIDSSRFPTSASSPSLLTGAGAGGGGSAQAGANGRPAIPPRAARISMGGTGKPSLVRILANKAMVGGASSEEGGGGGASRRFSMVGRGKNA